MTGVSVCMIVKNEEEVLARCLDSLKGIYDELIIVDTGSTDNTKMVARKYTDLVYDYAWEDDFSAARNFSISKAKYDYVYTADADEIIDEENRTRFIQLKTALLPEVEVVEMAYANQLTHNTTSNFDIEFRPKLFRRLRPFQFVDPIHEVLRTDPIVYRSNVVIRHNPTSDHGGRDLKVFAGMVQKGQLFSSRLEMMYARELMIAGKLEDFRAARPYFERVRSDPSKASEVLRRASCVLTRYAAMENSGELLLRFAAPELVGQPPAEICCALGDYYLSSGDEQQAADWYAAALSGAQPELVAASVGSLPLAGLSKCFRRAGDMERAAYYKEKAENWNPEALNPDRQNIEEE
ncbi:glycosyltransferase family 2 protein [Ruminococcaceae bacterium OttesenSCG-928-I18]|nr:glycosyltransferase family 2 protein [Ruminococcaceae bacterium OttesenSCG-928-I18]